MGNLVGSIGRDVAVYCSDTPSGGVNFGKARFIRKIQEKTVILVRKSRKIPPPTTYGRGQRFGRGFSPLKSTGNVPCTHLIFDVIERSPSSHNAFAPPPALRSVGAQIPLHQTPVNHRFSLWETCLEAPERGKKFRLRRSEKRSEQRYKTFDFVN